MASGCIFACIYGYKKTLSYLNACTNNFLLNLWQPLLYSYIQPLILLVVRLDSFKWDCFCLLYYSVSLDSLLHTLLFTPPGISNPCDDVTCPDNSLCLISSSQIGFCCKSLDASTDGNDNCLPTSSTGKVSVLKGILGLKYQRYKVYYRNCSITIVGPTSLFMQYSTCK